MINAATLVASAIERLRGEAPDLFMVLDALDLKEVPGTYEYTDKSSGETKTDTIETVTVSDRGELLYNPAFITGSDEELVVFGLAIVASMFQTNLIGRRGDRDVRAWGIASNICAVEWLAARGFSVPSVVIRAEAWGITFDAACTPEEVYALLPREEYSDHEFVDPPAPEGTENPALVA
jgi:hypothetical protein